MEPGAVPLPALGPCGASSLGVLVMTSVPRAYGLTTPALVGVKRLLDELVDALEVAKSAVPAYSVEAVTFIRPDVKVIRRRVENIRKAIGDPAPSSAS